MNSDNNIVDESLLHRYVDGELGDVESENIRAYIADNPDARLMVDQYREINRRLKAIYSDNLSTPIPARLLLAASNQSRFSVSRIAASILWLGLGAIIGYSLQQDVSDDSFLRPLPVEAANAHAVYVPEVRHPVEVDASEQQHLNAWLSKRLDRPIAAPDLRDVDFSLIGGRLLPDGHRAAAQFMYEDADGERITLFIRQAPNEPESSFLHAENNELGIVYWVDNGLAYAITAATDRQQLKSAAQMVYESVNP